MNRRFFLTLIWFVSFMLAVLSIELYYWAYPTARKLIPSERPDAYKPVLTMYGAYLAAILAAWFKKPFPPLKVDRSDGTVRFVIAVSSTLLFNLLVLYFISLAHWGTDSALSTIRTAMKLAAWFSILVAPVNLYYFGVKAKGARDG